MATLPDITTLLRQKELMGGIGQGSPQQNFAAQQIVSNPQAALMQNALQYGTKGMPPQQAGVDTSGPTKAAQSPNTASPAQDDIVSRAAARVPGLGTVEGALTKAANKIYGGIPAAAKTVQAPPQLMQRDPAPPPAGYQLVLGPDGSITTQPMSVDSGLQKQAPQYNPGF